MGVLPGGVSAVGHRWAERDGGSRKRTVMSDLPPWLDGARVAPSRFNTQPWRFEPQPTGEIVVGWDSARELPASDPDARDLFLSLGAAVECAALRATAAGTPLEFVPADHEPGVVGRLVARTAGDERVDKRLAAYLDERRTARTRHLRMAIPPLIQLALRRETVGWGCRFHIVTEDAAIRRVAGLVRRGTYEQYRNAARRAEMAAWYRLDPLDRSNPLDGVPLECLDLHGFALDVARRALSPERGPRPVRRLAGLLMAQREWTIARQSAAFCLLTAPSTERSDLVRTGRLMIRLWLLAAEAGLMCQAISPVLQSPTLSERCGEVFQIQGGVPASLFRVGYCPPVAASPRLPPGQLLRRSSTSRLPSAERAHR